MTPDDIMPGIDPLQKLYETRVYPAMSHPLSDPAVSAVAARLGGLAVPHPAAARILEIGCCSGLNLIPLAMRWPDSRLVGIDLSGPSIRTARNLARAAGVTNIEFHAVDLREFDPAGEVDFIIAHGFFSWVPDEVKAALLAFCHRHLAPDGIATVSFNLESGWRPRMPVIAKVRAILRAGAEHEMSALAILRSVTEPASPELAIIDDMIAKGPAILAFDDFGPINDPWPLDRFVHAAAAAGLRWLGESHPANNLPPGLDPQAFHDLRQRFPDPLALQVAGDEASMRTFRSGILCRAEAQASVGIPTERVFELAVRMIPGTVSPREERLIESIASYDPSCIPVSEVMEVMEGLEMMEGQGRGEVARRVWEGMFGGWIEGRVEPVRFEAEMPEWPELNGFQRECVRLGMPLVDIWHRPCSFPGRHDEVLAAMDGTRDRAALGVLAKRICPELAFEAWLRHLAGRGMFA